MTQIKFITLVFFSIFFLGCNDDNGQKNTNTVNNEYTIYDYPVDGYSCEISSSLYEVSISRNHDILRNGCLDDQVIFVFEDNESTITSINGKGNMDVKGRIGGNLTIRAWLAALDDQTTPISNVLEYQYGDFEFPYVLTMNQNYVVTRNDLNESNIYWVVDLNGQKMLKVGLDDNLSFQYQNNEPGNDYRIWLEKDLDNDAVEIVSNIIKYSIDDTNITMPYQVSVDENHLLTRSGSLGDYVTWVIVENGTIVLKRWAQNEKSYTYFNNQSQGFYQVWLIQGIDGYYQRVSNIIEYTME